MRIFSRKNFMKMTAVVTVAAMLPWTGGIMAPATMQAAEVLPTPAYMWDFEAADGSSINSKGSVAGKTATLKGTAETGKEQLGIGNKTYSDASNTVLTLKGGTKGSSYVELPSDLYGDVTADTGLSWSFWMKTAADVESYSRLFSSSNSSNGMEFAYAPYASDTVWNLIFDDGSQYMQLYGTEPAKAVWNYITITVSEDEVVFYTNGEEVASSCTKGGSSVLRQRLNGLAAFTNHALGKTTSTWSDKDCEVQLDDVAVYNTALTASQVAELAKTYGLEPAEPQEPEGAQEGFYGADKRELTQVPELTTVSADGKLIIKIWTDENNAYYYSVSRDGKVVLECSALGLNTKAAELVTEMELDAASVKKTEGVEKYDILQGSVSSVNKKYNETAFTLEKGNSKVTICFRVFDDGMAYRYEVDGDISGKTETTIVTGEASEFVLPDSGKLWTAPLTPTYEPIEYAGKNMKDQYAADTSYSAPILGSLGEDSGKCWVLLAEANVYNEAEPYCASVFKTVAGSKAMQVRFGRYLVQETDDTKDKKTYSASYADITEVNMKDVFHTPWRVAVIADSLEGVTNSSLIMDLNLEPEYDFSWVEPGASVWSWWSSSYDAIQYSTMIDNIDFAAAAGMEYCLVDYGWELWDNYEEKIASLVEYAESKDVGILVWYGVNKFDGTHIFDLDNAETIEKEFAWCQEVGIKGVKVDYINSDSQFAMEVMYYLADIAAQHELVLNYHGCTDPNGENRTYPNILSSEAVAGMECYKWNNGSSVPTLLTIPYTRNVLGSMEFTPTGYRVHSSNATSGFMLATTVVYESAVQTFAQSVYNYPGYNGLSLISDLPTTWDESRLLSGYPGESIIRARRKDDNWYLGAMTLDAATYDVKLDFLDKGVTYNAYIYSDNEAGDNIEITTRKVTSDTVLNLDLLANGGCSIKFSKTDLLHMTPYDDFNYYEAEDADYGVTSGAAAVGENQYASNLKTVGYIGSGEANKLTFENIEVPVAGEYKILVYYVCGSERDLYIKVNDGEEILLENLVGNANDWKATCSKEVTVELKKGVNEICLYNNNDYAPDIDRIAISKTDMSDADVQTEADKYTYTGKEITPSVTVKWNGKTLKENTDYTVAYVSNINAGTAKVVVRGTGYYCGTITKTFVIEKAPESTTPTTPVKPTTPTVSVIPTQPSQNVEQAPVKGKTYTVGKMKYKVTKTATATTKGEVTFASVAAKKLTKVTIQPEIKIKGYKFKVTAIKANALKNNKKITSVIIGKNIRTIEKNAFYNCKKLKTIKINSAVLKSVGKNALKGISKKATIKVPKKKLNAYKTLLKGKGQSKTVKIKK